MESSRLIDRGRMGTFATVATLLIAFAVKCVASVPMTSEQEENMPDFGDPSVASRLKCSACRGSAYEIHDALNDLRKRRRNPTEFEITETMDSVCEEKVTEYGLQLRNNLPTHKFSKDTLISRAQGSWASRYIGNVCSQLYSDYEDRILENQRQLKGPFIDSICRQVTKLCDQDQIADKTLGDFDPKSNADESKTKERGSTEKEL